MKLSTLKWWRMTSIWMMIFGILFYFFVYKHNSCELLETAFGFVIFLVTNELIRLREKSEKR